jgi:hypothetical protein
MTYPPNQINETRYREALNALRGDVAMDRATIREHARAILDHSNRWEDHQLAMMMLSSPEAMQADDAEKWAEFDKWAYRWTVRLLAVLACVAAIFMFVAGGAL